jgi:hypothetical protein
MVGGEVPEPQGGAAVDLDPRPASSRVARYGDLDLGAALEADSPERRRAGMAENGTLAAGEDCRHPASVAGKGRAAD